MLIAMMQYKYNRIKMQKLFFCGVVSLSTSASCSDAPPPVASLLPQSNMGLQFSDDDELAMDDIDARCFPAPKRRQDCCNSFFESSGGWNPACLPSHALSRSTTSDFDDDQKATAYQALDLNLDARINGVPLAECCNAQNIHIVTGCEDLVSSFNFGSIFARFSNSYGFARGSDEGFDWWHMCSQLYDTDESACIKVDDVLAQYMECSKSLSPPVQRRLRRVAVQGVHYPTLLSTGPGDYFWIVPALDAFVGNRLMLDGWWNIGELTLLKTLVGPGDYVIDVGANIGSFTVPLAAHVGAAGRVFAFEPFLNLYQLLTGNVGINGLLNTRTFQVALSNEMGSTTIPTPNLNMVRFRSHTIKERV